MLAKISAGNDYLRFPQVTGGILPAPAGNSHEVFIVRVRVDFIKPRDVFLSSTKQFDQCNHLLSLRSMVNPSKTILFQKKFDCSLLALQSVIQRKTFQLELLHSHQNDQELAVVNF